MTNQDIYVTFGERLKLLRKDMGLNQKEFAHRLGKYPSTVGSWEKAANKIGLKNVINIAIEFDVSLDWLLGFTDDYLG